jgi:hypothetical protein
MLHRKIYLHEIKFKQSEDSDEFTFDALVSNTQEPTINDSLDISGTIYVVKQTQSERDETITVEVDVCSREYISDNEFDFLHEYILEKFESYRMNDNKDYLFDKILRQIKDHNLGERVMEALPEFKQYEKESIKWGIADFTEMDVPDGYEKITEEQAQEALERMIYKHDAEHGIGWHTLSYYYTQFATPIKEKDEE